MSRLAAPVAEPVTIVSRPALRQAVGLLRVKLSARLLAASLAAAARPRSLRSAACRSRRRRSRLFCLFRLCSKSPDRRRRGAQWVTSPVSGTRCAPTPSQRVTGQLSRRRPRLANPSGPTRARRPTCRTAGKRCSPQATPDSRAARSPLPHAGERASPTSRTRRAASRIGSATRAWHRARAHGSSGARSRPGGRPPRYDVGEVPLRVLFRPRPPEPGGTVSDHRALQ